MKTIDTIFIPGIFCMKYQFKEILNGLKKAGFKVYYFKMKDNKTIDANIGLLKKLIEKNNIKKANFVTHSFGSFLFRAFYKKRNCKIGRIVQFGPMDNGSIVLDAVLTKVSFFKKLFGKGLGEDYLKRKREISKLKLPFNIGVIAGDKRFSWKRLECLLIPFLVNNKDSDGKVLIKETRFHNMHDFLKVHEYHSDIHTNKEVIKQTNYFLNHDKFLKS